MVHPRKDAETKEDVEASQKEVLRNLQRYHLQKNHIDTLKQIFTTPIPHYKITWVDLRNLIQKCGGSVDKDTGSSRRIIRLPSFDVHTMIVKSKEKAKCITQRGVHETHQPDRYSGTISRWYINIFRTAFERAGITLDIIERLPVELRSKTLPNAKR